jgi:GNAT superfamily N-acetyltransferase
LCWGEDKGFPATLKVWRREFEKAKHRPSILVLSGPMTKIRPSTSADQPALFEIWHDAVRATHLFLTEADIAFYAVQVRDHYLPSACFWIAAGRNDEPQGFMGMTGSKIDALFVHPKHHGLGIGRALMERSLDHERPQR